MIEHCDNKLDKVITNMHTKRNAGSKDKNRAGSGKKTK